MLEQFISDEDSGLDCRADIGSNSPAEVIYIDIMPSDLVSIVVDALGQDKLSPNQTALVLDAAAESAIRQNCGSNSTFH